MADARWEHAAGGVLRDERSGVLRIAVVRRTRHVDTSGARGDWVLPKGHLEQGESWVQAALREVREETGCPARVAGDPVCVSYLAGDVPKLVVFYPMDREAGETRLDTEEVSEVVWLTPGEALRRLTYPAEQGALRAIHPEAVAARQRWVCRFADPVAKLRTERLRARIRQLEFDLDEYEERAVLPGSVGSSGLRQQLADALTCAEAGQINQGWVLCNATRRHFYRTLEGDEVGLRMHAARLRQEVDSKLKGWRREAALQILDEEDAAHPGGGRGHSPA